MKNSDSEWKDKTVVDEVFKIELYSPTAPTMSQERERTLCAACTIPLDPNGDVAIFAAGMHLCTHKVCEPCWRGLDANNNGQAAAPSDQRIMSEWVSRLLWQSALPAGSCTDSCSEVWQLQCWHQCKGICLCKAVIHPSVI